MAEKHSSQQHDLSHPALSETGTLFAVDRGGNRIALTLDDRLARAGRRADTKQVEQPCLLKLNRTAAGRSRVAWFVATHGPDGGNAVWCEPGRLYESQRMNR
jgi:hypothetical protein